MALWISAGIHDDEQDERHAKQATSCGEGQDQPGEDERVSRGDQRDDDASPHYLDRVEVIENMHEANEEPDSPDASAIIRLVDKAVA